MKFAACPSRIAGFGFDPVPRSVATRHICVGQARAAGTRFKRRSYLTLERMQI